MNTIQLLYLPQTEFVGVYCFHVRPSVHPSVRSTNLRDFNLVQKGFWWQNGFMWLIAQTPFSASTEGLREAKKSNKK